MSSFDADGFHRPPPRYDANHRRHRLHRDKYVGLWWRMRADGSVVWEYKPDNKLASGSDTLQASSEREAIREWEILRGKLAQGDVVVIPKGDVRLDDAWALYAAELDTWVEMDVLSDKTRVTYSSNYRLHIQPALGRAYLAGIGRDDIIDLFRDLYAKGLSGWTSSGIKNVLKHCLDKAVEERWISISPLDNINSKYLPKQEPREDYEARLFRNDELLALFAACPKLYREPLILMALTGLRISEVCGIHWQDVNLLESEIHVRRQVFYNRFTRTWGTTRPKGPRTARKTLSRRSVGLLPSALEALEERLVIERAKGFGNDGDFVFTTSGGRGLPIAPANFRARGVQVAGRKAGLGHLRPHDLRHTTASVLAAAGVTEVVAAQWMGHTVEEYHDTYAKAFKDAQEREQTMGLLTAARFGVGG